MAVVLRQLGDGHEDEEQKSKVERSGSWVVSVEQPTLFSQ